MEEKKQETLGNRYKRQLILEKIQKPEGYRAEGNVQRSHNLHMEIVAVICALEYTIRPFHILIHTAIQPTHIYSVY